MCGEGGLRVGLGWVGIAVWWVGPFPHDYLARALSLHCSSPDCFATSPVTLGGGPLRRRVDGVVESCLLHASVPLAYAAVC